MLPPVAAKGYAAAGADRVGMEGQGMRIILTTAVLLGCSNIFMTFAW